MEICGHKLTFMVIFLAPIKMGVTQILIRFAMRLPARYQYFVRWIANFAHLVVSQYAKMADYVF